MARGGTDWGTLALLGVGAVVVYGLLGRTATSPAPAAPQPTTPKAPNAPTTAPKPPAERDTGLNWLTPPGLRVGTMTDASTQSAQTGAVWDAYRPSAAAITSRDPFRPEPGMSAGASRFLSAQEARLQADDVAALLPATASTPIPQAQPADTATYTPTGSDYGNLAQFQSQISQTTYQTNQTPVAATDTNVYADTGDQSRRRIGGAQE